MRLPLLPHLRTILALLAGRRYVVSAQNLALQIRVLDAFI